MMCPRCPQSFVDGTCPQCGRRQPGRETAVDMGRLAVDWRVTLACEEGERLHLVEANAGEALGVLGIAASWFRAELAEARE